MKKIKRVYGWKPDLPDHRDLQYSAPCRALVTLPPKVDLRAKCPPVVDQKTLGSCTANAIAGAHQFEQIKQGQTRGSFAPSRLFIYYNERAMEGTINEDSGAYIRDGMKSVVKQGVCPETPSKGSGQATWPYVIGLFTQKPPKACYTHALKHQVLAYQRVPQLAIQMSACLAAGFPFVFGFSVFESFESKSVAKTGVVPMPGPGERMLGGHAVMCVGYADKSGWFIVRNSWGTKWGDKGYCYMPYAYLTNNNLADDFWTIRMVEEE